MTKSLAAPKLTSGSSASSTSASTTARDGAGPGAAPTRPASSTKNSAWYRKIRKRGAAPRLHDPALWNAARVESEIGGHHSRPRSPPGPRPADRGARSDRAWCSLPTRSSAKGIKPSAVSGDQNATATMRIGSVGSSAPRGERIKARRQPNRTTRDSAPKTVASSSRSTGSGRPTIPGAW